MTNFYNFRLTVRDRVRASFRAVSLKPDGRDGTAKMITLHFDITEQMERIFSNPTVTLSIISRLGNSVVFGLVSVLVLGLSVTALSSH